VPVRATLEDVRGGDDIAIVANAADELDSHREFFGGEAAGHTERRQAAKIADAAERIGKGEVGFEIGFECGGGDGERRGGEDVVIVEKGIYFRLEDSADALGAQIVGGGNLLADVPGDLAERVGEFSDLTGFEERVEGGGSFDSDDSAACRFERAFGQFGVGDLHAVLLKEIESGSESGFDLGVGLFPGVREAADPQRGGQWSGIGEGGFGG